MGMSVNSVGVILISLALLILVLGICIFAFEKGHVPFTRWKLPGDIHISRGSLHIWIPLGACILFSIMLTIALNLLLR